MEAPALRLWVRDGEARPRQTACEQRAGQVGPEQDTGTMRPHSVPGRPTSQGECLAWFLHGVGRQRPRARARAGRGGRRALRVQCRERGSPQLDIPLGKNVS